MVISLLSWEPYMYVFCVRLTCLTFPVQHWHKTQSNDSLISSFRNTQIIMYCHDVMPKGNTDSFINVLRHLLMRCTALS